MRCQNSIRKKNQRIPAIPSRSDEKTDPPYESVPEDQGIEDVDDVEVTPFKAFCTSEKYPTGGF
jgi:hypothetical protein